MNYLLEMCQKQLLTQDSVPVAYYDELQKNKGNMHE